MIRIRSSMTPSSRVSLLSGQTLAGFQGGTSMRSTGGPGGSGLGSTKASSSQSAAALKVPSVTPAKETVTLAGLDGGRWPTAVVSSSRAPGRTPGRYTEPQAPLQRNVWSPPPSLSKKPESWTSSLPPTSTSGSGGTCSSSGGTTREVVKCTERPSGAAGGRV